MNSRFPNSRSPSNRPLLLADSILPIAIPSEESFGVPHIRPINYIGPVSVGSQENVGVPTITTHYLIVASSIGSEESFGLITVVSIVQPTSITSAELFGEPLVRLSDQPVKVVSIQSTESFGIPFVGWSKAAWILDCEIDHLKGEFDLIVNLKARYEDWGG